MPKAISYLRFSRAEQAHGDSFRRQIQDRDRYLAAHPELILQEQIRDEGKSAYKGKHAREGGLGRLLEAVQKGEIEPGTVLLVENLDRLSRQEVMTALKQFILIAEAGITIVTTDDQQEYSSADINENWHKLVITLAEMARAHEESKRKGQTVGAAWANKRKLAAENKTPMTARLPAWLELSEDRQTIHPIPERAAIVRRIFEETIAGIGRHTIARRLNESGIPPFAHGRYWHDSAVQKILNSEAAFGRYQPHTRNPESGERTPVGEPIDGFYPVVVPEEDFWRAKAMRGQRKGAGGPRGVAYANLLTGLCRCGECGSTVVRQSKGPPPKGGAYLLCDGGRKGACTNRKLWRYDHVEAAVLRWLDKIDVARVMDDQPTDTKLAEMVTAMEAELADVERRRQRAYALYEAGDDLATDRYHALTKEAKRLDAALGKAKADLAQQEASAASPAQQIISARALRDALASTDDPDELFTLRAKLAQELRRCISAIGFGPDYVLLRWSAAANLKIGQKNGLYYLFGAPPAVPQEEDMSWYEEQEGIM